MERTEPTHSEDPSCEASSSLTFPPVGDYEDGIKEMEGNYYEVFLSFRGKDTRNGFTAHLYTSLVDAGIHVFRDDDELHVGEEIGPELLRSITQSKIFIPIISEDYASSKWCLRELALMLNCKRNNKGHMVLPIFYKVEPWQVKHLTGRFGDAINTHKNNLEENIVKEWEEALKEVTSLKGLESEKINNGNEAKLVETVVKGVFWELKRLFWLDLPEYSVGIDDRVRHIKSSIDPKFSDTRIIGIYGMGGIGKTTLARALCNELTCHYEYRSFLLNIRETSKYNGIKHVQKKLISDIMKKSWDVYDVDEGIRILKSQLTMKKVLILLDDVDDDTHLNALIGDKSWFKAGSTVIITTRNKSILHTARAYYMHSLEGLPLDLSLILFSRHAFRKDSPPSDYEKISRALVSTTKGLPLAIEVIASLLSGKRMEKWKNTLKELKEVPAKEVQKRLRISYEALHVREKYIFLDIACFFIGESQQNPTYMWDACGFFPWSGIEELCHRSLIKIDEDGTFMMHDQLRDLGREIVRQEGLTAPQNRSRLWSKEAKYVLDGNVGTSKIEALDISMCVSGQSCIAEKFKELTNLRLLRVCNVNLTGDFQNLLPQLKWLKWMECCLDFGAVNFHPKKLIVLDLSSSGISEVWGGWGQLKVATELKVLNLATCALRTTPDLSTFKSLEILILECCEDLEKIHPSIENIETLVSLNVTNCLKLKELPLGVGKMEELRELLIRGTDIQEIPISRGCLTKLETLDASNCGLLARLPDSLGSLVSLQCLFLSECRSLREIPYSIGELASLTELHLKSTAIEELPESIGSLKELKTLNASYCASLARIPSSIGLLASLSLYLRGCDKLAQLPDCVCSLVFLQHLFKCSSLREIPESIEYLESLTELDLKRITLKELPEYVGSLKKLETLDASYCASLACLPSSIGDLVSLSLLDLTGCDKLAELPNSIGSLRSLQHLLLSRCCSLRKIPDSIGKLESLTELHLKSTKFEELPESIGFLKELKTLNASNSASLVHIPSSIGHLASLSLLDLTGCDKLAQLPDSIGSLVSLQCLLLSGCRSLREIPESIGRLESLIELHLKSTTCEGLPESIGFLKELKILDASYCASLACIPNSIGHLASLSLLDLTGCDKLAQIPNSIGSLVSLHRLLLSGCHSLREIPNSLGKLTSLTELYLKSTAIMELPESILKMQHLKILDIGETPAVNLLGDSILVSELQELRAVGRRILEGLPSNTGKLVLLKKLDLDKFPKLSELWSCLLARDLLKPSMTLANNSAMDCQTADFEHVLKRSRPFGISNEDSESMADGKPRITDDSRDKSRNWKLTEINEPSQCRSIRLPDHSTATRVSRLIYTNSGVAILALSSNAVHKLWKWGRSDRNLTGRATTSVVPQLWQPASGILMTNDVRDTNPEDAVPCFALSKNDSYLISASGGKISLFNMMTSKIMTTFLPSPLLDNDGIVIEMEDSTIQIYSGQVDEIQKKLKRHQRIIKGFAFSTSLHVLVSSGADSQTMTVFMPPPPLATFLAFCPQDNNIIAIGMEDSSIHIYNVRVDEFKANLKGHQKRITGLAFSKVLNVLVSSGADSQLCVWSTDGWKKQASKFLQMPTGQGAAPFADTRVQFHVDQIHLLVVHETQIATCKAPELECLKQWDTRESSAPITDATYSCNGQSIYVSFEDGSINVLSASTLRLRCRINPAAYIPPDPNLRVYPLVISTHPSQPNQFALGLTDGSVYVLEPLDSEGEWAGSPSVENGAEPSTTSGATSSDQPQK